jgi:hypothetical protein
MDKFYIIVLAIAIILLILILTYVGITMGDKKKIANQQFPPSSATCPDYWDVSTTDPSFCSLPKPGFKNIGDVYDKTGTNTLTTKNTFGYDSTKKIINFNDKSWENTGVTTLCAKKKWANNHGIVWDGISNSNTC